MPRTILDDNPTLNPRQRLVREGSVLLLVPVLVYLAACLWSYQPGDPSWSHSGSVTGRVDNWGSIAGAWFADLALALAGVAAYALPILIALLLWTALRPGGGDRDNPLTPALRLTGSVGCLLDGTEVSSFDVAWSFKRRAPR